MKQLLIPVLIAVLAGVGGGSGFAYMRTSKAFVADSIQRADSIKAHPPKKAAPADAPADAHAETAGPMDAAPVDEPVPMTPADSLRAVEAARAGAHGAGARGGGDSISGAKAAHAPEAPKGSPAGATASATTPAATADVANLVRAARSEAMNTALPEQRLAKIFAAMSAKDAAKVMEQMPDADVRSILALMSDRSAAAVLAQFPAARAATITKGASKAPGNTP
jgi:hypothetical protein